MVHSLYGTLALKVLYRQGPVRGWTLALRTPYVEGVSRSGPITLVGPCEP